MVVLGLKCAIGSRHYAERRAEAPEPNSEPLEVATQPSKQAIRKADVPYVWRFGLSLEVCDVNANDWDGEYQPGKCTDQGHEELSEVFVRGLLVGNQGLPVHGDILYLWEIMLLVCPYLKGRGILFVNDPDTIERSPFGAES